MVLSLTTNLSPPWVVLIFKGISGTFVCFLCSRSVDRSFQANEKWMKKGFSCGMRVRGARVRNSSSSLEWNGECRITTENAFWGSGAVQSSLKHWARDWVIQILSPPPPVVSGANSEFRVGKRRLRSHLQNLQTAVIYWNNEVHVTQSADWLKIFVTQVCRLICSFLTFSTLS